MKDLDAIYYAARELPPADRPAYLTGVCGTDSSLRSRVEQMLAVADQADAFLTDGPNATSDEGKPGGASATTRKIGPSHLPDEVIGQRIGRYKILERVGEGGCGVVYVAEQTEPVRRRVALKVIKLGMDTKAVVARFEAERQALAMMDHPNIAKVLDAGATDPGGFEISNLKSPIQGGRPYFVMELVRGIRITDYCDQHHLSTKDRLVLFMKVCHAIQHAHQKGIIHRDIKPSNVLVTLHDGVPVPKVIDFGIAKATEGRLSDLTVYTELHQFIGTPAYMSPEQAEMSGLDIDTRSDIYALGVLLYELLTGQTPFDAKELVKSGIDEIRRTIREVEPPKPSTRLTQELAKVGKRESEKVGKTTGRATESHSPTFSPAHFRPGPRHDVRKLQQLIPALRGDLDWIVMTCLEKDRTRRYETANGLAMDIRRHLDNEPIRACPPSTVYRFQKLIRRNKVAFAAGTAITASLVIGIAVSLWQAVRATQARQDAEAISKFLTQVFQSPDPARDGRTITVAETLDKAAKKLETDLATQPARRASLQATLGRTYHSLGLYREALSLQGKARDYYVAASGPKHPDTLAAMHSLAISYGDADRLNEAIQLGEEELALRRELNGPEHPDTLRAMNCLGIFYFNARRRDEGLKLREEVLPLSRKVLGPEHPDTLNAIHNLAKAYFETGRRNEALKLREEVLALRRKVNGPEHPDTLKAIESLAISYADVGREQNALKLREEALVLCRKVLGSEHPHTLQPISQLALSYAAVGRDVEALKLREEVLTLSAKVLGPEDRETLGFMTNLAISYGKTGRLKEAIALQERTLAIKRRVLPPDDPFLAVARIHLARLYEKTGRNEKLTALRQEHSVVPLDSLPTVVATLVPPDSEWKWLHPTDGVDPALRQTTFHSTFFTPGYDDSAWKSGKDSADPNGGFGYGRGFNGVDIGLPPDESHRHSAYFRHRFTTDKPHARLELRGQRDDAIIVYLDGVEVLRDNLPAGPEAYLLAATIPQGPDNDGVIHRFPIPGTLAPGQHVLALSVHNTELPSSDLRLGGITLIQTAGEPKPPQGSKNNTSPPASR